MIVLSAGLPKSGTGLLFNLTNDLLEQTGHIGVRRLRENHHLEDLLEFHNCLIDTFSWNAARRLLPLHWRGHRFVVKTHGGPNPVMRVLSRAGILRATYLYRDPRDVVLSAIDHGRKLREQGQTHTFAKCRSLEDTIPFAMRWLVRTTPWMRARNVLCMRYEDLIGNPIRQMEKLAAFLDIDPGAAGINLETLYRAYDIRDGSSSKKNALHLNRGIAGRFRNEMSVKDLARCNQAFRDYLPLLGYEP